jgi:aliphatic nitrilase
MSDKVRVAAVQGEPVRLNFNGGPTPVYADGGSYARVFGPYSVLITEALDPTEEGNVYADINLADIDLAKNIVDPAGLFARADVTQPIFDDTSSTPVIRRSTTMAKAPGLSEPKFDVDIQWASTLETEWSAHV